jgi:hypothetical protein
MRLTSRLELDHAIDCELEVAIERITEQPIRIRYLLDGTSHRYPPDALVTRNGRPEIREVKFEEEASEPENEQRWPAIGAALNSLGFDFRVVTEKHVREPVRFATVQRIWDDRMTPFAEADDLARVVGRIRGGGPLTHADLAAHLPGLGLDQLHAMVRHGFLAVNLNSRVGPEMRFGIGSDLTCP